MRAFCTEMINNLSNYFKNTFKRDIYPNQDEHSCNFIIDSCMDTNPDYVLDIGTSYGASALSSAYAIKQLGKSLSIMTAIDLTFNSWEKATPTIQKDFLNKYDIDQKQITCISSDFRLLDPTEIIKPNATYFIFYDIHDMIKYSFLNKFLDKWLPLISNGVICFHDISVMSDEFVLPPAGPGDDPNSPRTLARAYDGKNLNGFLECSVMVDWLNKTRTKYYTVDKTSILYIRAGE